jgi:flagellar hook-length control protein FliK
MGSRVLWMVNQGSEQAELSLNPAELGPVKVRIRIEGDQAVLNFAATQAPTREALEAALPRLREMFAEAGLNLAQADVSHRGPGEGGDGRGGASAAGGSSGDDAALAESGSIDRGLSAGEGLLDTYA